MINLQRLFERQDKPFENKYDYLGLNDVMRGLMQKIINHPEFCDPPATPRDIEHLKHVIRYKNKERRYSSQVPIGRKYPDGMVQGKRSGICYLSRSVKRFLFWWKLYDFDLTACHQTIVNALLLSYGLKNDEFSKLCSDPINYREKVKLSSWDDKCDPKQLICKAMMLSSDIPDMLLPLKRESQALCDLLNEKTGYKYPPLKNYELHIQEVESAFIWGLIEHFRGKWREEHDNDEMTIIYTYDGFMFDKRLSLGKAEDWINSYMNNWKRNYGFSFKYKIKQFEEVKYDLFNDQDVV